MKPNSEKKKETKLRNLKNLLLFWGRYKPLSDVREHHSLDEHQPINTVSPPVHSDWFKNKQLIQFGPLWERGVTPRYRSYWKHAFFSLKVWCKNVSICSHFTSMMGESGALRNTIKSLNLKATMWRKERTMSSLKLFILDSILTWSQTALRIFQLLNILIKILLRNRANRNQRDVLKGIDSSWRKKSPKIYQLNWQSGDAGKWLSSSPSPKVWEPEEPMI